MNDNELIAWNVVDRSGLVQYTCLNESTANYLRDWCEAIDVDKIYTFIDYWVSIYGEGGFKNLINENRYYVNETEIIVN